MSTSENLLTMLNHKLHHVISGLHIRHLSLNIQVSHNRRRKHDGNILRIHQVLLSAILDARQVEHEELEGVAVDGWEGGEGFAEVVAALVLVSDGCEVLVKL